MVDFKLALKAWNILRNSRLICYLYCYFILDVIVTLEKVQVDVDPPDSTVVRIFHSISFRLALNYSCEHRPSIIAFLGYKNISNLVFLNIAVRFHYMTMQ